ncbi:hypothetical protein JCM8097_005430 [Rhodosporidiobolus ruineniae]
MPPSPPPPPPPPVPAAKGQHAKIHFINGKDRSEGKSSILTWVALPEGAAGSGGSGTGARGEAEEDNELRIGVPQGGPGYPQGEGFGVDTWAAWPTPGGELQGLGTEVMDLTGVASDKDSANEREWRAADAWEAAEQCILQRPSSPPPSPTATAANVWRKSDEDFHPPLARLHYTALHSLSTMIETLYTLIRTRCDTAHVDSAACARAVAELCTIDLVTSVLGLLKVHARKEAEDEHEHQVERMQCVTYGVSLTAAALSSP